MLRLGPGGDDQAVLYEVVVEADLLELAFLVGAEMLNEKVPDSLELSLSEEAAPLGGVVAGGDGRLLRGGL